MNATETITKLQAALRDLDERTKPHGLYAIREARGLERPDQENWAEWREALKPALADLGFRPFRTHFPTGSFDAQNAEGRRLHVQLVRLSTVKVRQFGNAYRVDPHHDFASRWQTTKLEAHLRSVARLAAYEERLLIFLGFAAEARPFRTELDALARSCREPISGAESAQVTWPDPHGRGFQTLCACWHWPEPHDLRRRYRICLAR
jgi:hypothetical protein